MGDKAMSRGEDRLAVAVGVVLAVVLAGLALLWLYGP